MRRSFASGASALAIVGTALALAPLPASAAAPSAAALKAVGISVSWTPGQTPVVAPGTKYAIRVSSARARSGGAVKIRAVRVGSGTVTSKVLVAQAVKRGLVRIPFGTDEARFIISVKGGGVSLRTVVRLSATEKPTPVPKTAVGAKAVIPTLTPAPAPGGTPAAPSTPAPLKPAAPTDSCKATDVTRYSLELAATTVAPGDAIPYTVRNLGAGCITGGVDYTMDELIENQWFPVSLPYAFPAIALSIPAHGTYQGSIKVPDDAITGHFRATTTWGGLPVSAEFDVLALIEN